MKKRTLYITLTMLCLWLAACKKDDGDGPDAAAGAYGKGVFILNEGNFNNGDASLAFYHPGADSVERNVFRRANGRPLGDVLQSMLKYKSNYYVVVNNSQRIEVMGIADLKTTSVIEGFSSPRYIQPVANERFYVTDLYANGIWVVKDGRIEKKIPYAGNGGSFGGWTEQMLPVGDKIYVCAVKARKILVVDPAKDAITDSLPTGPDPQGLVLDSQGKLWVLCNGFVAGEPSRLQRFDPLSKAMLADMEFSDKKADPKRLKMDGLGNKLYFLDKDLYQMEVSATALPVTPLASSSSVEGFYGLGVDPVNSEIYLGDAQGFLQSGKVYRYNAAGELKGSYGAGIGPGDFYFIR